MKSIQEKRKYNRRFNRNERPRRAHACIRCGRPAGRLALCADCDAEIDHRDRLRQPKPF